MPEAPLVVDTGVARYPIHVGAGLLSRADLLQPLIDGRDVFVLTDENVAGHYLKPLQSIVGSSARTAHTLIVPPGETSKSPSQWVTVQQAMIEAGLGRDAIVIALGGGVVGDLAGFVAATFMRGIDFVQIPTTLLAQVDSSVGGKTGINLPEGKNLVGAFHQPRAVLIDVDTLKTLPQRELAAGMAETIKYGAIMDRGFLEWIESRGSALTRSDSDLVTAIRRSCAMKAEIVARDEREGSIRALLNFGHTFGHAIEAELGYSQLNHGEAVAIGMCAAAQYSITRHGLNADELERLSAVLRTFNLPTSLTQLSDAAPPEAGRLAQRMLGDKKNLGGRLRLIGLRTLGDAFIDEAGDLPLAEECFAKVGAA